MPKSVDKEETYVSATPVEPVVPTLKKHRKTTQIRKLEIVEIAWDLVTRQGAGAVTLKNIAREAQLSEAAVYRHFKDKHAILLALIDNFERRLMETLEPPIRSDENPLRQLKAIMKAHLVFTEKQQRLMFAITAESLHFNDDGLRRRVLHVMENYKKRIKDILLKARKKGLIRSGVNLDAASFAFLGLIEAAVIQYALTNYTVPPLSKFNTLWNVFLNGIYESQPDI